MNWEIKIVDKWDVRFLRLANMIGTWSKEENTQVGCVIVDNERRIISTGYNGLPRGAQDLPERLVDRELKLALTLHAEDNALLFAKCNMQGFTAYITHPPCSLCAAKLIQVGIKRIVFRKPHPLFLSKWGKSFEISKMMCGEAYVVLEEVELC